MQLLVDPKDAIQFPNYQSLLSRENTHDSAWKPQHSRKPRNSQANRTSEKNHSNDNAVWAPVRVHNKLDVADQTSQKEAEPSLLLLEIIPFTMVPKLRGLRWKDMFRNLYPMN